MSTEGERRARALVQVNVRDVVFILGVEGERFRFLEVNPAFSNATGLREDQVVGRFVDEILPEPSLTLVLSHYRTAIAEQRTVRWEEVSTYPAGRKYGQVSVTPLVDPDGRCRTLIGTVHDITLEARARALQAMEKNVLEMIASGARLEATLETLVRGVEELAPPVIASILLVSDDGERVLTGAAPSLPEAYNRAIDGRRIGPSEGSCGTAAATKKPVIVADIERDPLWEAYRDIARAAGLRACWSTPILTSDARVLGTFAMYYREPRSPTEEHLALIERAVHVAGIALQRHELEIQLRALSSRIEEAREEERSGIAREIHDQLGQALTVMKMDLAWIARRVTDPKGVDPAFVSGALLEKVTELASMADGIIGQVRRISSELRPGVLDDLGLVPAMVWKAQDFERRTGIACAVEASTESAHATRAEATTLYRVLEEALTNVARHAEAKRVDVRLDEGDHELVLRVRDDGKGIRPQDVHDRRSLGLLGIRERARRHGGSATFGPVVPRGTEVVVRVPARS